MRKGLSLAGISANLLYFGVVYLWLRVQNPDNQLHLMALGVVLLIPTLYLYFLDAAISFRYDRERRSVVRMLLTVGALPVCYFCYGKKGILLEIMNGYFLTLLLIQVIVLIIRAIQRRKYRDE